MKAIVSIILITLPLFLREFCKVSLMDHLRPVRYRKIYMRTGVFSEIYLGSGNFYVSTKIIFVQFLRDVVMFL